MGNLMDSEPVRFVAALSAAVAWVLNGAVLFGVELNEAQLAWANGAVATLAALVLSFPVRSKVTAPDTMRELEAGDG